MDTHEILLRNIKVFFERYRESGGTQSSLAIAAGVKQSQVSVWLRGGYLPSAENLPGLARAFGVRIEDFYRDSADQSAIGAAEPTSPVNTENQHQQSLPPEFAKLIARLQVLDEDERRSALSIANGAIDRLIERRSMAARMDPVDKKKSVK